MVSSEMFASFIKMCVAVNPDVDTEDVCDLVGCVNCPHDHLCEADQFERCQDEVRKVLEAAKEGE